MRIRMKTKKRLYPHWRRKKLSPAMLAKERDGNVCVECGVPNRSLAYNAEGEPYILYLHASHLSYLDPYPIDPIEGQRLRARCPHCHGCYDAKWRRREEAFEHQRRLHCIGIARWFEQRFMRVE
jgi:hypothetical protein